MYRLLLTIPLLAACGSNYGVIDLGSGTIPDDDPRWDDATLRIVQPASGSFLAWGEVHTFEAEVVAADGEVLSWEAIDWRSDVDAGWGAEGASFDDDQLDVGIHGITAETRLPNGDRLAHTIGGLLVQSPYAGTYVGIFMSNVDYDGIVVPCVGSAVLVVEPYGKHAEGSADCLISVMGFEMPATYLFDLDNDEGVLTGVAGVDIGGMFTVDFEADGTLAPETSGLDIAFGGEVLGMATLDASVDTTRISLDAGL